MIKVGDTLPGATLMTPTSRGPEEVTLPDHVKGKKVVLFAVPGAYTPTCHQNHLPGYLTHLDALKAKGVEEVLCVSVNDIFVMGKWSEDTGAAGKLTLLADGSAAFTQATGLTLDASAHGLGLRSQRYAMIVDDGVVTHLAVEDAPPKVDTSGAEAILAAL